jgi:GNAT superfamily N-acetyltransferase
MMTIIDTCRDLVGRAGHAGGVVRQLDPRNEADVLGLLRRAGGPGRAHRFGAAPGQSTLPPAAWAAGLFVANELTGVARAGDALRAGHVEAELFVDEAWRRRGIGSMLLKETMNWARRGEATMLRLVCDRNDWPMRHFAEAFGARLDLVFGQMVADIPLVRQ